VNDTSFISSGQQVYYTQIGPAYAGCVPGDTVCNAAIAATLNDQSPMALWVQNAVTSITNVTGNPVTHIPPVIIPIDVATKNNSVLNVDISTSEAVPYYEAAYPTGPPQLFYIPYNLTSPPPQSQNMIDTLRNEDDYLYLKKIDELTSENDNLRKKIAKSEYVNE